MIKHVLLAASLVAGLAGCERRKEAPTQQEKATAAAAKAESEALEAATKRDEQAREAAKEKTEVVKDTAEAAKDKAEDIAKKVGAETDWKGPSDSFDKAWVAFSTGWAKNAEMGDYMLERDADGVITAWRKTQQVAGDAFADLKDAALVTEVKAKLAADADVKASDINVDAQEHVVSLSGTVAAPELAAKAVRMALSTPGAEKVVSHLTVKK